MSILSTDFYSLIENMKTSVCGVIETIPRRMDTEHEGNCTYGTDKSSVMIE